MTVIRAIDLEREDNLLKRLPRGLAGLKFNSRAQQLFLNGTLTQATLKSASLWLGECAFPFQQRLKTADCVSLAGAETPNARMAGPEQSCLAGGGPRPRAPFAAVLFPK